MWPLESHLNTLDINILHLSLDSIPRHTCDTETVTQPLCASVSLSIFSLENVHYLTQRFTGK